MELEKYLEELVDASKPVKHADLTRLSSVDPQDLRSMEAAWRQVAPERRVQIITRMAEIAEDDLTLDFTAVFVMALRDPDEQVRERSVAGLWECEDRYLIALLINLLQCDQVFSDSFAIWPKSVFLGDDCRTNLLRLTFFPVDNPSQEFDPIVAQRVADRLLRFKPLHVEIERIVFDGLRGSSQTWLAQGIVADAYAASHWCSAVIGSLQVSSQTWCMPVQANTL